jgi:hypothetical protein
MNPKDDGQSAMGELKRTTDRTDDTDESLSPDYSPSVLLHSVRDPVVVGQNDLSGGMRRPPPFPQELLL